MLGSKHIGIHEVASHAFLSICTHVTTDTPDVYKTHLSQLLHMYVHHAKHCIEYSHTLYDKLWQRRSTGYVLCILTLLTSLHTMKQTPFI